MSLAQDAKLMNALAAHQNLLGERFHLLLTTLHPTLRADVISALEEGGKLLSRSHSTDTAAHSRPAGMWPLLTLLVAQHVSPEIDLNCVSSVAIAVECFICALDLLDDIEDDDQTAIVQSLGTARVLNVSTTLLMLAQRAILSVSQYGISPEKILRLLDTLQNAALVATAGQHMDLLSEQRSSQDFTREESIEIAAGKAGSLMRLACRLGVLCAAANQEICDLYSELGELLGIAHQFDNDSHDLYQIIHPSSTSPVIPELQASKNKKTDLIRGKKTLPVVLAAKIDPSLQKIASKADEIDEAHIRALDEGITITWGLCLLYRKRAYVCLEKIEAELRPDPILRYLLGFE